MLKDSLASSNALECARRFWSAEFENEIGDPWMTLGVGRNQCAGLNLPRSAEARVLEAA